MKRLGAEKARLLREIQYCSEMLQGSLVVLYRKCGKKGCRCERGEKHGPAYYLSYKEGGVTQMVYIPVSRLGEVKKAMEAFSRYWELGVKLSRLNLEYMGLRAIWEFVGRLDLSRYYEDIEVIEGEAGRPALDPRLMISLWIYAYSKGIGSAREVSRLCEYDPASQWLTGMEPINSHTF